MKDDPRCGYAAGFVAAPDASSTHFHTFHNEGEPSHDYFRLLPRSGQPRGFVKKRSVTGREACRLLPALPRASDLFESLFQNYSESEPQSGRQFP